MRRAATAAFLCFLLLECLFHSAAALAQEKESILERILNPMPDYDPFDNTLPPPKFFPDEVDKRVREALIDGLTGKTDRLADQVRFLSQKDRELKKERGTATGLTEIVSDLLRNTIRDRDLYLEAQRKALASSPSREQKQLITWRLWNDPLTQADDLMKKSAANRWGAIFNRLLGSVDLISIVSGSYIGAAVDSAMSQLLQAGSVEMPIEERRALSLYREHLRRYPDYPRNQEIEKRVAELEKKQKRTLIQKEIEKAQEELARGELEGARFHLDVAALIDPAAPKLKERQEEIEKRSRRLEEERRKALSVDSSGRTHPQDSEATGLLYALTLRDPLEIEERAKALPDERPGSPLADSARDSLAVAREIRGQHEEAKRLLREIARSAGNPHEKKKAELLLKSPEYNLLASFEEARRQRRFQTVKYVLLGEDLLRRNLLYATGPLVAGGPAGATSVAAANVLMIGTNLFHVLSGNPISYEPVIDKGVAYIRTHPQAESATEVYSVLADAYEEVGRYDKAIAYQEMSGKATEERIGGLKEKAATALLQAAEKTSERSLKEAYLKMALRDYSETSASKEAIQRLSRLMKIEHQGLRISKKFLMENPELFGPQGLGLKPTLFDGNLANMELAEQGLNLLNEREILLHFQTSWGIQSQSYAIEKEKSERFQIALRKKHYEVALEDLDARPEGSQGGIKNLPLSLLRGELARKEKDEESTFRLVRKAESQPASFPKVLDYELMSETEKAGGKFTLPPIQGSIAPNRFDIRGSLPAGLWGDRLSVGADAKSPFAGLQLPIPLLQGFIPVDFLLLGGPRRLSIYPKIHISKDSIYEQELYR